MKWLVKKGCMLLCLIAYQTWAQPGLKGEYYVGTNFERKAFTRIDRAISFNWRNINPAPGIPTSYYSIRWTGRLLAPVTGKYTFYAKVDDGIRVWVGNKKVMDSWQLNDSRDFSGSVMLKGGSYYDLRVDFFNDMLEGEIQLYWERPDKKSLSLNPFAQNAEPISASYFFQKTSPAIAPPKPKTSPVQPLSIAVASPKVVSPKQPTAVVARPPVRTTKAQRTPLPDTATTAVATVPSPATEASSQITPGVPMILHHVQFEQSSYILLPESSSELNKLVRAMKANPQWSIYIAGHTDNVGDPRLNLALSENRAKVVANYLMRQGIADERITTEGFGGKQPLADNATEGGRSQNRRVEITIR